MDIEGKLRTNQSFLPIYTAFIQIEQFVNSGMKPSIIFLKFK